MTVLTSRRRSDNVGAVTTCDITSSMFGFELKHRKRVIATSRIFGVENSDTLGVWCAFSGSSCPVLVPVLVMVLVVVLVVVLGQLRLMAAASDAVDRLMLGGESNVIIAKTKLWLVVTNLVGRCRERKLHFSAHVALAGCRRLFGIRSKSR